MSTSQTERIGVNAVAQIVTKNLDWIWRELTVADFGIDGIIEQRINGKVTGKLIAVQIKSGLGNVKNGQKDFTYYASKTHKQYWSNYCIPVILVLYDPDQDRAYWTSADEQDFKKTVTRWKLSIPKNQEFSEKSEKRLSIIFEFEQDPSDFVSIFEGTMKAETLFDHVAKLDHIKDSFDSIMRIVDIINEMREKVSEHNKKLQQHIADDLNDKDPQVKATIKSLASSLNLRAQRIESELEILAQAFSESIYSLEIVTISHYQLTLDLDNLNKIEVAISEILKSTVGAMKGIEIMENSFKKYPKKYPSLKVAKDKCLALTKQIKEEFTSISNLSNNLIKNIENAKNINE